MVPKYAFLTKGVGTHPEKLASFEAALRTAGIAAYNLVKVSSIFPPYCKLISKEEGLARLKPGQIIYCVLSSNETNEPHRLIAASIGLAIPRDTAIYGYLSEHHSYGQTADAAGDYAEDLAAMMLATTLGFEIDLDKSWDEQKELYQIENHIVLTRNITQTAIGNSRGFWTTVLAAVVFIMND
ncbi:MAG: arginine decarboxylase, pyruvoyl-dependent [Candidatus Fischerbacteria bacterium RBG_13_37_8]|uniref:Pyruvoyl-dependent arginine decarboxylase AaxB n=1 Tax=Candidatus Fischerbacteria bacterium RBG_13_37_8 TaxID=1817863 RepID=A0A1F5V7I5_9BACT|nr:MAG: arginine decarboxylase, pyruvoyl-dependent [Candidatus Fischerbacteria bacterium RBG_13_37_8]